MKHIDTPLRSVIIALLLVVVTAGIVIGIRLSLSEQTSTQSQSEADIQDEESFDPKKEYLDIDKKFEECYLMVRDVPESGMWANQIPGKKDEKSKELSNGQILKGIERGTYDEDKRTYYRLDNGLYVDANIKNVEPLTEYIKVNGYLAITYISSSGINLRSWADFDADNVVKTVYVGEKIQVKAKVITEKGVSAYITSDDLYITTDTRYLNDYTSIPEEETTQNSTDEDNEVDSQEESMETHSS